MAAEPFVLKPQGTAVLQFAFRPMLYTDPAVQTLAIVTEELPAPLLGACAWLGGVGGAGGSPALLLCFLCWATVNLHAHVPPALLNTCFYRGPSGLVIFLRLVAGAGLVAAAAAAAAYVVVTRYGSECFF